MRREQKQRRIVLVGIALAASVLIRHVAQRGEWSSAALEPTAVPSIGWSTPTPLDQAARDALTKAARARLEERSRGASLANLGTWGGGEGVPLSDGRPKDHRIFLSLSRRQHSALVERGEGASWTAAVLDAADRLAERATAEEIKAGLLKVDVVLGPAKSGTFDAHGRAGIDRSLDGLWLPGLDLLLLPEELLARRLATSDGDLQSKRLRRYLAEGGRRDVPIVENPGRAGMGYRRVRFDSFVEVANSTPARLYRGNRRFVDTAPGRLLEASLAGGEYLLRHQRADGTFGYSYLAKENTYDTGYNLLRHAGTCYALLELYGETRKKDFLVAARLGLEALLVHVQGPRPEHMIADFDTIVSPGEEAKLGGAALTILAMVEHRRVTGDSRWAEHAERLARFLLFQQRLDPGHLGRFRSKYFYGPPDAEPFESIYYPGEAILALARLYRQSGRDEHLEGARRGASWLIEVRDAGKSIDQLPHDHWLLMGLAELYDLTGEERWVAHGKRIAQAIITAQRRDSHHPDWVGSFYTPPRSTPTATRAEALVAWVHLARRAGHPSAEAMAALKRMATFQLRCQLTPESVMYLPRPDRALGGFRRSLTHWEVRIDYVQHNISALLGWHALLETESG